MKIDELIENFSLFDQWEDRYRYIIDLGKKLPVLADTLKTDTYKVRGCMSQVWFVPDLEKLREGIISFQAASDAFIVTGLIAILRIIFEGKTIDEARAINIDHIFHKLGLEGHLSPTRRNGFFAMIERIRSWMS